jgi:hypothetical protein
MLTRCDALFGIGDRYCTLPDMAVIRDTLRRLQRRTPSLAIEAEFLVEKRHGDHFEHAYSYDWTALKGWHYLMKLAHLLNVLTLWSRIGSELLQRRGYRDAIRFLRETWTGRWLSSEFLQAHGIGALTP